MEQYFYGWSNASRRLAVWNIRIRCGSIPAIQYLGHESSQSYLQSALD
jgi:hypothetical protein